MEGFAPRDGSPRFPQAWNECLGAWAPLLGPTGLTLHEWSGTGNDGVMTNMTASSAWTTSNGRYAMVMDGSDDYVSFSPINITGDFYVSTSLNFNSLSGNRVWISSNTNGWTLIGTLASSTVISVRAQTPANLMSFTVPTLVAGVDYCIVVARNAGVVRCYVNGAESSTGALASTDAFMFDNIGYQFTPALCVSAKIYETRIAATGNPPMSVLKTSPSIAYEMAPRKRSSVASTGNRRRRLLVGAGS